MSTAEPARTYRSGPLSIRTSSGPAPRSRTIWSSIRVLWSASIERATRIVAGVFVDDGEQFQRAAVAGGVELEVQGPDMVGALGAQPLGGHGGLAGPLPLAFPLPHRSKPGRTTLPHVEGQRRGGWTAAASWLRRASGDRSKNTANRTAVARLALRGPKPESMMVPCGARRSGQKAHPSRLEQARRFFPSWSCEFDSRHPLHRVSQESEPPSSTLI